jgi:hypothetical protein
MGEHGYKAGMVLVASTIACAAACATAPVADDLKRQHLGQRPGFIPVDRSYRSRRTNGGNSGTLSKLLAAGRRRGRV